MKQKTGGSEWKAVEELHIYGNHRRLLQLASKLVFHFANTLLSAKSNGTQQLNMIIFSPSRRAP